MTSIQLVDKNKGLIQAFRNFKKRYLNMGKKPNIKNLLPEDLYHTMRLEGEKFPVNKFKLFLSNSYCCVRIGLVNLEQLK